MPMTATTNQVILVGIARTIIPKHASERSRGNEDKTREDRVLVFNFIEDVRE